MARTHAAAGALLLLLLQQGVPSATAARTPSGPTRSSASAQSSPPPPQLGYTELPGAGFYKVHLERVSWTEAQAACEADSGHLFVANSPKEAAALRPLLARQPTNVSNELHAGFLRPDYFVTVFGSPFSSVGYQKWAPEQQNTQTCGTVNHVVLLYDAKCTDKRSFICEYKKDVASSLKLQNPPVNAPMPKPQRYEPINVIPPPTDGTLTAYEGLMQQGSLHYYAVSPPGTKMRWSLAKAKCEKDGGHLLVLNHQMEADVLKEHIKKFKGLTDTLYVGLRNGNNKFVTVFGNTLQSAGFDLWESEQPEDETCLTVDHNMLLKKAPCWEEKSFICETTLI